MKGMTVVFRADASLLIGSGHVMRCLTLAEALKAVGAECHFICREHPGNLISYIESKSFPVHKLRTDLEFSEKQSVRTPSPSHADWLGTTQLKDANASKLILEMLRPDWLVVDHYSLDEQWEKVAVRYSHKLMVIDDLADRAHLCDLLLDQNLGRLPLDYKFYVPSDCELLIGPRYALLRKDFAELRNESLSRRASSSLKNIIITMGGVDEKNVTSRIMLALSALNLRSSINITVVMGGTSPWLKNVKDLAATMPYPTKVLSNIDNMAEVMLVSDLAIGAAGSTSWERCCLGLPSLFVILAANQMGIGKALQDSGSAISLGSPESPSFNEKITNSVNALLQDPSLLERLSAAAATVTDGAGCAAVVSWLGKAQK